MKYFDQPTCLILFNIDNTISSVTCLNEINTVQLFAVVGHGIIHGC